MSDDTQDDLGPFGQFGRSKKREFLDAFVDLGGVVAAAFRAGIHRNSHYGWMQSDPEYAAAFARAEEMGTQTLEAEAVRRALETSDTLLIFMLKARNREKYGDKQQISFDKVSDEALLERARKSDGLRSLIAERAGQTGTPESRN